MKRLGQCVLPSCVREVDFLPCLFMCTLTGLNNICLFTVLERPIFKKKKKGNQSFYLFFRLVQLGWERESVEFFVRVIVGNNL